MSSTSKSDLGLYYQTRMKCDPRFEVKGNCSSYIDRSSKIRSTPPSLLICDSQSKLCRMTNKTDPNEINSPRKARSFNDNNTETLTSMNIKMKTKSTGNLLSELNAPEKMGSQKSFYIQSSPSIDSRKFSEPFTDAIPDHCKSAGIIGNQFGNIRKMPEPLEDYIMKNRKFPLKGLHKISRSRFISQIELANTYITSQTDKRRIDIDASVVIIHLQFLDDSQFKLWQKSLTEHRLYDQYKNTNAARDRDSFSNDKHVITEEIEQLSLTKLTNLARSHSSIRILHDGTDISDNAPSPVYDQDNVQQDPISQATSEKTAKAEKNLTQLVPGSFVKLREKRRMDSLMNSLLNAINSLESNYENLRHEFEALQSATVDNPDGDSPTRSEFFSPLSFLPSSADSVRNKSVLTHLRKVSSCSSFQTITESSKSDRNNKTDRKSGFLFAAENFTNSAARLTESARQFMHNSKEACQQFCSPSPAIGRRHLPISDSQKPSGLSVSRESRID